MIMYKGREGVNMRMFKLIVAGFIISMMLVFPLYTIDCSAALVFTVAFLTMSGLEYICQKMLKKPDNKALGLFGIKVLTVVFAFLCVSSYKPITMKFISIPAAFLFLVIHSSFMLSEIQIIDDMREERMDDEEIAKIECERIINNYGETVEADVKRKLLHLMCEVNNSNLLFFLKEFSAEQVQQLFTSDTENEVEVYIEMKKIDLLREML